MNPDVSVVIVSWNVREILKTNLERLFSLASRHPFEVIVIDNGSTDGSAQMIRTIFPNVHLIQNDVNRGFAYACNQGLRNARGSVLLLFNPDMLIGRGVLDHLFEQLTSRQEVGAIGVRLFRPDGSHVPSVRRDPTLLIRSRFSSNFRTFSQV